MESINIQKSKPLIACGGSLVIFNGALLGFSLTFLSIDGFYALYAFVMASSGFHMMLGFIAVIGGYDTVRQRRCVIVSLIMSIVGSVIFILPAIFLAIISWLSITHVCEWNCLRREILDIETCSICGNVPSRFLPILVVSIFIGMTDIVLSGLNCSNLCNCCNGGQIGFATPGIVINPSSYATYPPQYPVQGHYPSNYSINPPVYAIDAHILQEQNQSQLSDYQVHHGDRAPILSPDINDKFY